MERGSRGQLIFVNALTFSRFPFIVAAMVCMAATPFSDSTWFRVAGLLLLVASAITDFFDGKLARKWNVTTRLGAICDPLLDKVFFIVVFPSATALLYGMPGELAHATLMLFFSISYILRDQWVAALRAAAAGLDSKTDMKAGWTGKVRTALSFPIGCLLYAYVCFQWGWLTRPVMVGIEVFGLLLNLFSVYVYTKRYGFALRQNLR